MQAIQISAYGGPEVVRLAELPKPACAAGQVLVAVHAAGVNPVDWKVRNGWVKDYLPAPPPFIIGGDFSGVVEAVGADVQEFRAGDAVFGMTGILGAYAEYVAVAPFRLALKPIGLSHVEAASIPMAAITAWQGLFRDGGLKAGQRVLVHAASGGVGGFAVQLAHAAGAHVIAGASAAHRDYVKALGADEIFDSRATEYAVRDIDLVFDTLAGEAQARSWATLKRGGTLVCAAGQPDAAAAQAAGVTAKFVIGGPDPEGRCLREIAALIDAGKLRTDIQQVFPLAEAARAIALSEAGHVRGKLVLQVR